MLRNHKFNRDSLLRRVVRYASFIGASGLMSEISLNLYYTGNNPGNG